MSADRVVEMEMLRQSKLREVGLRAASRPAPGWVGRLTTNMVLSRLALCGATP